MSVDASPVRDRLGTLVPADSPATGLLDQLRDGMDDREYAAVAVAIVRTLSRPPTPTESKNYGIGSR
jgi:hypothetical protein